MSVGFARRTRQEFEQPRHECFRERNAWSLYNAATEQLKHENRMSNAKAMEIQLGMTNLLCPPHMRN